MSNNPYNPPIQPVIWPRPNPLQGIQPRPAQGNGVGPRAF